MIKRQPSTPYLINTYREIERTILEYNGTHSLHSLTEIHLIVINFLISKPSTIISCSAPSDRVERYGVSFTSVKSREIKMDAGLQPIIEDVDVEQSFGKYSELVFLTVKLYIF